ncbi:MAG: GatB/YqeY domain-containing protein [bacterium]|nr:GatB/YqeY domain-containing protein [bacterium]
MTLLDRVKEDLKTAMRQRDSVVMGALRMLLSALQQKEKDKHSELSNEESQVVVASEAKKRREAIEGFKKGGAIDRAEQEQTELTCLLQYLPEQMREEEIRSIVKEAIEKTGASSVKDMGKLMAEIMPKVKGKADGSAVNKVVKENLAG